MESNAQIKRANLSDLSNKFDIPLYQAFALQKLARSLHRSYENECNYGLTDRQEKRERNLWAKVETMAKEYGFHVEEQGDPRGWPIIIDKNPIDEQRGSSYERVCPY